MGMLLIGAPPLDVVIYGQSNAGQFISTTSSPPSAAAGTYVWDNSSAWGVVPSGNGVRELLNALKASTGRVIRAVYGYQDATPINGLTVGNSPFTALASRITASGINAKYIIWIHGENDQAAGTTETSYRSDLSTGIHQAICDVMGLTKAQCKLVLSSVGRGESGVAPDAQCEVFHAIQWRCQTLPYVYYSHTMIDQPLSDGTHFTAAAHGESGKRFANTIAYIDGLAANPTPFYIDAASVVDATHTDVNFTHSLGTDFTPTSGITGFRVSNDNGYSYATPSAAVRQSASTIRLTHSDLGTISSRLVDYLYGRNPAYTGAVHDNSGINAPLNFTAHQILQAQGGGNLPVPIYRYNAVSTVTTAVQTISAPATIGPFASDVLVMILGDNADAQWTLSSAKLSASSGDIAMTINAEPVSSSGADRHFYSLQATLPVGSTYSNLQLTFNHATSSTNRITVWTVPVANLNSTAPLDIDWSFNNAATVSTVNITTGSGGFSLAAAMKRGVAGSFAFSGTDNWVLLANQVSGPSHSSGSASGTSALTNACTITATATASGDQGVFAVSYR